MTTYAHITSEQGGVTSSKQKGFQDKLWQDLHP
jgi:hypothetical protein